MWWGRAVCTAVRSGPLSLGPAPPRAWVLARCGHCLALWPWTWRTLTFCSCHRAGEDLPKHGISGVEISLALVLSVHRLGREAVLDA